LSRVVFRFALPPWLIIYPSHYEGAEGLTPLEQGYESFQFPVFVFQHAKHILFVYAVKKNYNPKKIVWRKSFFSQVEFRPVHAKIKMLGIKKIKFFENF